MFKADDYRLKLKALSDTLAEAKYALDIANIGTKLEELKIEQEKPEAEINMSNTNEVNPYLLLMAHTIIHKTNSLA